MTERGVIEHRARAQQIRDFSGLRYGNITPTDVDALIEYKDIAYIIIETKYGDVEIPRGQMLAFERLCDDLQNFKQTIFIISRHNYPIGTDIDLAKTVVEKYRLEKRWIVMKEHTKETTTVRELIDRFIESPRVKGSK